MPMPENTSTGVWWCRSIDVARDAGAKINKTAAEIIDNSFTDELEQSGFLKELWGRKLP